MPRLGPYLWIILLVSASITLVANKGFRRLVANALAIRRLTGQVDQLQKEEGDLHSQIERLKKDDLALEKAARAELGYLKPGEIEYRFPPPK